MQTSRMPTPVQWLDERARHVMSSRPLDGKDSGTPTETKVFVLHQNWFKGNSVRKPLCLDERHRSTAYLGFISPWKTPPAWSLCANGCRSATPSACLQVDCSEWSEWSANTYERLVISTEWITIIKFMGWLVPYLWILFVVLPFLCVCFFVVVVLNFPMPSISAWSQGCYCAFGPECSFGLLRPGGMPCFAAWTSLMLWFQVNTC